jgi:hypothetical protein
MSRGIKGLTRTPTYAAIMKRFNTNLTCPRMEPLPAPLICPFLMNRFGQCFVTPCCPHPEITGSTLEMHSFEATCAFTLVTT